jgi:Fe-S cluster assembly protein SufD
MESALDFYLAQSALTHRFPQLEGLQRQAQENLKLLGFPKRSDEDWKYSSTDAFCQKRFSFSSSNNLVAPFSDNFPSMPTYLMSGEVLNPVQLPEGVVILPWADALMQHAEKIGPFLGHILKDRHGFHAQNTSMLSQGFFIYLPEHTCLDVPVRLFAHQHAEGANYFRHLIVLEEGASIALVEDYSGDNNVAYYTNTVTEACLHARSSLKHYKILREGAQAYHVGQLAVQQDMHSSFQTHAFSLGGEWVRSDIDIQLKGEYASCMMNGIYMTQASQHLDHHTKVYHQVPHCTSEQDYKGLVTGASRVVFNGVVNVCEGALKTVAHQSNKNLLLSKQAEVDTKPQLEIYADDVVCTHGATVGQLDEEALFYLEARGIPVAEARAFLMRAFLNQNLQKIGHSALADWMEALLTECMGW